jgi:hypothetical protein
MNKNELFGHICVVLIVILVALGWSTYSLWTDYREYKAVNTEWLDKTEERINKLQDTAWYMTNVCEQYLAEEQLLMDYGNDYSTK